MTIGFIEARPDLSVGLASGLFLKENKMKTRIVSIKLLLLLGATLAGAAIYSAARSAAQPTLQDRIARAQGQSQWRVGCLVQLSPDQGARAG